MLELSKSVLLSVSFDKPLFKKELLKAIRWVRHEERTTLKLWCMASFGHVYHDVIAEAFDKMV